MAASYTALSCLLASMAGYAFAKFKFRGRNVLFLMLLITMMIPAELNITPLYLIFSKMKWLNTYRVQIIPGAANVFAMFLMRQYMMSIPDSLIEAARIDGAGEWKIFSKIVLPISSPSIGALAILHADETEADADHGYSPDVERDGFRPFGAVGAGAFRLYAGHNPFNYRIPHVPG